MLRKCICICIASLSPRCTGRIVTSLLAQESLPVTLLYASALNMTNCYSSLHLLLPYTTPVTASVNTRARCSAIPPRPP